MSINPALQENEGAAITGSASEWVRRCSLCGREVRGSHGMTVPLHPAPRLSSWHSASPLRQRALFFRDPEDNVVEIYAEI